MHPSSGNFNGCDQEDIVLGYKASQSGSYVVSGAYMLNGTSLDGIDAYIKNGSTVIWSTTLTLAYDQWLLGNTETATFSLSNIALNAGDYLYFGINAKDNDASDWGHLQGVISTPSSVPLPRAVLLFGPGLVGLAAVRRRFKK